MSDKDINMSIKMGDKSFKGIYDLSKGNQIDESQIEPLCQFVDERYDCADFRVVVLLKTIYGYSHLLSEKMKNRIKESLLNFKYWHDEWGEDSLCTWSENHQLIFHTCEYLAGLYFQEEVFKNSLMPGQEHVQKARPKLIQWFEHKFKYGFIEWHSNTYYEEDIAPLSLLIDYAKDEEIVLKATMIMDLLLLDMAMYSFDGYFSVCSGRCYEKQKKDGNAQDTLDIYRYVFGAHDQPFDYGRISSVFLLCTNYQVPEVIKEIANDHTTRILLDSMGLDLKELHQEFDMSNMDEGGAFSWQMEAFTNPETIQITMEMFNRYHLSTNDFLKDLKMVNHQILRKLHILPLLIKWLNPTTRGVAIQRNNSYTYKTKSFMLSTAMRYHPGEFGDQHHIWHAALPHNIHVFTTHPGAPFFDDNARNFSPSYWVGNGILPDSVQHENIHLSIYKVDQRKGLLERSRPHMTHAYFPQGKFDEVVKKEHYVFGRIEESFIALMGTEPLTFISEEEIIQEGKTTAWVCELGSQDTHVSFEHFIQSIESAPLKRMKGTLCYRNMELSYKGPFKVGGEKINHHYPRLETPYGVVTRKPEVYHVALNGKTMILNMQASIRNLS